MEEQNNIILYTTPDGKASVALFAKDGNVWMNQSQMAELFDTSKQNISLHTQNILKDKELNKKSVVKEYLTTAADGKDYNITFYTLDMILAVGFRVRSPRGVHFRQWANRNLKSFIIKGFVMDDERLKNPGTRPNLWMYSRHHNTTTDFTTIGKTKISPDQLGYLAYGEHIHLQSQKTI